MTLVVEKSTMHVWWGELASSLVCCCCYCVQAVNGQTGDSPEFVGQYSPLFGQQLLSMW